MTELQNLEDEVRDLHDDVQAVLRDMFQMFERRDLPSMQRVKYIAGLYHRMRPDELWLEAAPWGSFMHSGDPGACMYGFDERGVVQSEEHRRNCLAWIAECRSDPTISVEDHLQLNRMWMYLRQAEVKS